MHCVGQCQERGIRVFDRDDVLNLEGSRVMNKTDRAYFNKVRWNIKHMRGDFDRDVLLRQMEEWAVKSGMKAWTEEPTL